MKTAILMCLVMLELAWTYGYPDGVQGVGARSYSDTNGNRYGGTYELKDGKVVNVQGNPFPDNVEPFEDEFFDPDFNIPYTPNLQDTEEFFPEFLRNLENVLKEAFHSNFANQRTALNAARKAFDLTSNQAGFFPFYDSGLNFSPPSTFGQMRPLGPMGPNSAMAYASLNPAGSHQIAAISPENPTMQNINVAKKYETPSNPGGGQFYSVSSKSYSSSSNINGKQHNIRGSETMVNNNGEITKYAVHS